MIFLVLAELSTIFDSTIFGALKSESFIGGL